MSLRRQMLQQITSGRAMGIALALLAVGTLALGLLGAFSPAWPAVPVAIVFLLAGYALFTCFSACPKIRASRLRDLLDLARHPEADGEWEGHDLAGEFTYEEEGEKALDEEAVEEEIARQDRLARGLDKWERAKKV